MQQLLVLEDLVIQFPAELLCRVAIKQHEPMYLGLASHKSLCTALMVPCSVIFLLKLTWMTENRPPAR